jgi:type II secretory pathway pseudopilin PulG
MLQVRSNPKALMMVIKPLKISGIKKHKAFTLLEASLALALAGSAMVYALYQKQEVREEEIAIIEAAQLLEIQAALEKYLEIYEKNLIDDESIVFDNGATTLTLLSGDQNEQTQHPTLDNLKSLGLLSSTAATKTAIDSKDYLIGVINATVAPNTPASLGNGDCKTQSCTLTAYVYTDGPLGLTPQSPELNRKRIARVMNKLGTKGAETRGASNDLITSADAIIATLPDVAMQRGIVGAYANTTTLAQARRQPVANTDYCPAGVWEFNSAGVSNALSPTATTNTSSNCYAVHGDISVGLTTVIYDIEGSLKGRIALQCTRASNGQDAELSEQTLEMHTALTTRSCAP